MNGNEKNTIKNENNVHDNYDGQARLTLGSSMNHSIPSKENSSPTDYVPMHKRIISLRASGQTINNGGSCNNNNNNDNNKINSGNSRRDSLSIKTSIDNAKAFIGKRKLSSRKTLDPSPRNPVEIEMKDIQFSANEDNGEQTKWSSALDQAEIVRLSAAKQAHEDRKSIFSRFLSRIRSLFWSGRNFGLSYRHPPLKGRSLFLFSPTNKLRVKTYNFIHNPYPFFLFLRLPLLNFPFPAPISFL